MRDRLLPGLDARYVAARLRASGGGHTGSRRLDHPESSAALSVNAFGWFVHRPDLFPSLPNASEIGRPLAVDVQVCARLPWSGGRHPWLDAMVVTGAYLIGIESKRFEPFRERKVAGFTEAFGQFDWGAGMSRFDAVRGALSAGELAFQRLDAAQLVRQAYGLRTEASRRGLKPILFYIYAEPHTKGSVAIPKAEHYFHRQEVEAFENLVRGDDVPIRHCSYAAWLNAWTAPELAVHRQNLSERFDIELT